MSPETTVSGTVAPGFEPVLDAFTELFAAGRETGAAFAAHVDGERVVDLWGGVADDRTGAAWTGDTVCVMFSGTKGVVALALLMLVDRGLLDLDAKVTQYWPEFGAAGKEHITVSMLAAHAGGLPGVELPDAIVDLGDQEHIASLLAAQASMVPAGRPSYHAMTYGWLCAELVRRTDGRSIGRFVADEIATPMGLDLRIGMSSSDPLASRVAHLRASPDYQLSAFLVPDPDPRLSNVYGLVRTSMSGYDDPAILAIELPAANGVASARAMASLYGRLSQHGGGLVSPEALQHGLKEASAGDDPLSGRQLRFGATGFELNPNPSALGPPPDAFGHTGAGGSSHGAWRSLHTGFSYSTCLLRPENADGRARILLRSLHGVVDG